eukprot:1683626-Pleurochrysis_carterae.AAC.1
MHGSTRTPAHAASHSSSHDNTFCRLQTFARACSSPAPSSRSSLRGRGALCALQVDDDETQRASAHSCLFE